MDVQCTLQLNTSYIIYNAQIQYIFILAINKNNTEDKLNVYNI